MRKRAAAVLTPEAEQAAVAPPQDPMAAGGMPPGGAPMGGDPAAMGGAPMPPPGGAPAAAGPNGGQIPPEILQDAQFIQWLASQGVQLDQASGQFIGPDGQPLPAEAIMQAYQMYQQQMMGQQGGAPAGDPAAMGGAPAQGGQLPPEILNDQMFMQFMQEAMGAGFDPNSGQFVDMQSGQPIPPEAIMQAYDAFQQQMQAQGGGSPQGGEAPEGAAPEGGAAPAGDAGAGAPPQASEIQSMIEAVLDNFTSMLDKKLEAIVDKVETLRMAVESMRDTEDQRTKQEKDSAKELQDEIAADLQPTVKTASVKPVQKKRPAVSAPKPVNMFDILMGGKK